MCRPNQQAGLDAWYAAEEAKLEKWAKKDTYEELATYNQRIKSLPAKERALEANLTSRKKKALQAITLCQKRVPEKVIQEYKEKYIQAIDWSSYSFVAYDAESKTNKIRIDALGELAFTVPLSVARQFNENLTGNLSFSKRKLLLSDEGWKLQSMQIYHKHLRRSFSYRLGSAEDFVPFQTFIRDPVKLEGNTDLNFTDYESVQGKSLEDVEALIASNTKTIKASVESNLKDWAKKASAQYGIDLPHTAIKPNIVVNLNLNSKTSTSAQAKHDLRVAIELTKDRAAALAENQLVVIGYHVGDYVLENSEFAFLTAQIVRKRIEEDLANRFENGCQVDIKVVATADKVPVNNLKYAGEYGRQIQGTYVHNGRQISGTLSAGKALTGNSQLAYLRALGMKKYLEKETRLFKERNITPNYAIETITGRGTGAEYRRVKVIVTIRDYFVKNK